MDRELVRLVYIYETRYRQLLDYCGWPRKCDRQENMQIELTVRRDHSIGSPALYESVRLADLMTSNAGEIYREWGLYKDVPAARGAERILSLLRHAVLLELDFISVFHDRQVRDRAEYWSAMEWMESEEECNRVIKLGQPDQSYWVKTLFKLMQQFIGMDQSIMDVLTMTS